jgi:hypothetical protein
MKNKFFHSSLALYIAFFSTFLSARPAPVCDENSLRAAILRGGTVKFDCDSTIVLSHTLEVGTNALLDANGHSVTISGAGAVRIFSIKTNIEFIARGLTITNGKQQGTNGSPSGSAFGAGIYNEGGHVFLTNCFLLDNICVGGSENFGGHTGNGQAFGAAVYSVGGFLAIDHTLISSNLCQGGTGGGGDAFGGAISSKDTIVDIFASAIEYNSVSAGLATGAPSGYYSGGAGSGGSLYIDGGRISIRDTQFSQNHAVGGAESSSLNNTGSIGPARGGAVFLTNTIANLSLCKFLTNSAVCPDDGGLNSQGGSAYGGALFNSGELNLTDSLFSGNQSLGGAGSRGGGGESAGGAIYNAATLTLERCTVAGGETRAGDGGTYIDGAKPGKGGGIFNAGSFSATNTTIVLNQAFGANGSPGSAAEGGGIYDQGTMLLSQCTIASNEVHPGRDHYGSEFGPALGGGIFSTNGLATLQNTIVANKGGNNCFGVLRDNGNNLSSDATCQFTASGSFNNTDPLLRALSDVGGPTPALALLPGSPAIDHGLAIYCPPTDQRGIARPSGNGCDIGAFELQVYPLNTLTLDNYSSHLIHLIFSGVVGRNYQIQTTSDLTNWSNFQTNAPQTDGTFDIYYTNNSSDPSRFFRVYGP